jgi:DNA-directed RNA polymerase subunit RPC12/RpoP
MTEKRRHEMGGGGWCVCLKCGTTIAHRDGIRCQEERCPGCGEKMFREFKEKEEKKKQRNLDLSENESS